VTVPAGATCPKHAGAANGVCSRCGRFICPACTLRVGSGDDVRVVCEECAPRLQRLFSGSWLSVWSVMCGFVGLGCWILAPIAIVLGFVDLVRASNDGPKGGKTLDALGIALGVAGIGVGLAVLFRGVLNL